MARVLSLSYKTRVDPLQHFLVLIAACILQLQLG